MKVSISSPNLYSRTAADSIFEKIENIPQSRIIVDFKKVETISRSFAQQYLARKNNSVKIISEINVPENVFKMLNFVRDNKEKPRLEEMKNLVIHTM